MLSFSTALSALKANENSVDVVGNNLANLNTSGFKASSLAFSDMVSQTMGAGVTQIGTGVNTPRTVREFTQGPLQPSSRPLDAAISGPGFFVSQNSAGGDVYSRVGSFKLNSDGYLVTQSGDKVLGWSAVNGVIDASKTAAPIQVSVGSLLNPNTTTKMSMEINVNSQADAANPASAFPAPIEVVDSLGVSHVLTITFTKDTTNVNQWHYAVSVPSGDYKSGAGNGAALASGATGTLNFDTNGKLILPTSGTTTTTSDTITIKGLSDGAADMSITWSWVDGNGQPIISQLAAQSAQSGISQDGYEASELTQVSIADGGTIVAEYSNGKQQIAGQLAIANIRNPETLQAIGDNGYIATAETAQAAVGVPNSGGRGDIKGSYLEGSNVDIAREFTNLIVYQRGYQANAKVISAADDMSQQTINLIR
jgi:flagellar hook protein FlgE